MKQDDRTPEEITATKGFVIATDKFMSGWGSAPGRSIVACPFTDDKDRETVLARFERRSEFKRVRIVYGQHYRPRLSSRDHLHIYDTRTSFRYAL